MSIKVVRSVNFGSRKGSLSTIGYALYNEDGTAKAVRTTTGVFEVITAKGVYACNITIDDGWNGVIMWDTGEATPTYASEDYSHLQYSSAAGGGFSVQGEFLDKKEKDKFLSSIDAIVKAMDKLKKRIDKYAPELSAIKENLGKIEIKAQSIKEGQRFNDILADVKLINESIAAKDKNNIIAIKEVSVITNRITTGIKDMVASMAKNTEVTLQIENLKESIDAIKTESELIGKISTALLPTDKLEAIVGGN